jgi:hypothetical protein
MMKHTIKHDKGSPPNLKFYSRERVANLSSEEITQQKKLVVNAIIYLANVLNLGTESW